MRSSLLTKRFRISKICAIPRPRRRAKYVISLLVILHEARIAECVTWSILIARTVPELSRLHLGFSILPHIPAYPHEQLINPKACLCRHERRLDHNVQLVHLLVTPSLQLPLDFLQVVIVIAIHGLNLVILIA